MERLFFDGAMGTYLRERFGEASAELCCRQNPGAVEAVHRAYIEAGATALKTNSFGEHALEIAPAAWEIACRAAAGRALVFADIGPQACREALTQRFLDLGAQHFLFETFPDASALALARLVKERAPHAYVIASFAADPAGYTRTGEPVRELLRAADDCEFVDAVGLNCVCGPHHMLSLIQSLAPLRKPLCAMPNSGYPETVDGRTVFPSGAAYFASRMEEIAAYATHVGGCCGTTPEHIRAMVARIGAAAPNAAPEKRAAKRAVPVEGAFFRRLSRGELAVAVELDPPLGAQAGAFMRGAQALLHAGADAITIADCPAARVRADSGMLAAKLRRELGADAIAHMTCRDRNLNATRALLLALEMEGVRGVLAVTGDPLPSDAPADLKGVFSYHSAVLARYIRDFSALHVYGALNVNARNFARELERAFRKVDAGMEALFTQPVHTRQAAENLALARERLPRQVKLLGGILPVVSHKNALFLSNEMPGMRLDAQMVRRYEGLGREEAQALSIALSRETMRAIRAHVDGFYLITPFGRVEIIAALLATASEMR